MELEYSGPEVEGLTPGKRYPVIAHDNGLVIMDDAGRFRIRPYHHVNDSDDWNVADDDRKKKTDDAKATPPKGKS